jgi:hypothetical protein
MVFEVGQILEFVDPVEVDGTTITPGTHARVGNVLSMATEPTVTLVLLGAERGGKVLVNHKVASAHCRIV